MTIRVYVATQLSARTTDKSSGPTAGLCMEDRFPQIHKMVERSNHSLNKTLCCHLIHKLCRPEAPYFHSTTNQNSTLFIHLKTVI